MATAIQLQGSSSDEDREQDRSDEQHQACRSNCTTIGCPDAPGADDRGAGRRLLGGLARTRARMRGARSGGDVPLRPLPVADRSVPRRARRLGGDPGTRGPHGAARARDARLPRHLSAARGARQRLADGVHDLRWTRLARHGHRLDGGRARRVRLSVPGDEDSRPLAGRADRGRTPILGRWTASPSDRRRQRPLRDDRPGRPVRRRVQHDHGDARGVRRAPREAGPRVRARGPAADSASR